MRSILHFIGTHKALFVQLIIIFLFIGAMLWAASISTAARIAMAAEEMKNTGEPTDDLEVLPAEITPPAGVPADGVPSQSMPTPSGSTTPVESTPNQNETDGIIFAGILLVLIIVVGTLGVIRQKD